MKHRTTLFAALLVALAAVAAPTVQAQEGDTVSITLEGLEGDACDDDNFCYEVTNGELSAVAAGAQVDLTLENPSSNSIQHNVHVADHADANEGGDTDASQAFASTSNLEPGDSETITFTVPSDVDGTYLWCTIGAHESGGMWAVGGSAADTSGGDGGTGGNGSPGFGALAAIGAAGAALLLTRGRRD